MKKFLGILLLLATSIVCIACQKQEKAAPLSSYQAITLRQAKEKLSQKDDFVLYVGRPTCQHCRAFSPKLESAIQKTQVPVYYVNTDEETIETIMAFTQKEGVNEVPELRYYENGHVKARLDQPSQRTEQEIATFLEQTNS